MGVANRNIWGTLNWPVSTGFCSWRARLGFAVFLWLALQTFPAGAAPHLDGRPPPLIVKSGIHFLQRLANGEPKVLLAPPSYPATVRALFLRVDFPAVTDNTTTGDGTWTDAVYQYTGDSDYWVNKNSNDLAVYYSEVSYGLLTLTIDISTVVYRLPGAMATYGSETRAAIENLIVDSVQAADTNIDFSVYDVIIIVHAGVGQETDTAGDSASDIWSLYYSDSIISPDNSGVTPLVVDGVTVTEAVIMPQTGAQDGLVVDPFGIYAHEFGHWLGLPDLYSTAFFPLWDGIGQWGLMGSGLYNYVLGTDIGSSPAHLGAWSKVYLGWVTVQELATSQNPSQQVLQAVETNTEIAKLPASTSTPDQYFLLENRQLVGYDAGLPGSGLLIWLIDANVVNDGLGTNTVNVFGSRPGVAVIEADGDEALRVIGDGDIGTSGDPFPGTTGNTAFTPYTDPASTPYTGNAWVYVENIVEDGAGDVTADIYFKAPSSKEPSSRQCFIATAAHGSADAYQVRILRRFRDDYLLTNTVGRYFVELYYEKSPPIARAIEKNELVKFIVRILLLPFVGIALFFINTGILIKWMILMFLSGIIMARFRKSLISKFVFANPVFKLDFLKPQRLWKRS